MNTQKPKKKAKTPKKAVATVVIKGLGDNRWDYRTAEGISKEAHLKVEVVKKVLNSDPRIRHSVMKSRSGKDLYTLKSRRSVFKDYYTAFRAMNAEKLGDS